MDEGKSIQISDLMSQIFYQVASKPEKPAELFKRLNLTSEEGNKVLVKLERMGLLECYYKPTSFAQELLKLRSEKEY